MTNPTGSPATDRHDLGNDYNPIIAYRAGDSSELRLELESRSVGLTFVPTSAYLGSMGRDQAPRGVGAWLGLVVCLAAVAWTRGNDWFVDLLFGASLVYLIVHLLRSRPTQPNP